MKRSGRSGSQPHSKRQDAASTEAFHVDWQHTLTQSWGQRGLLAWLLWPLSLIYRLLVVLRHALYRSGLRHTTRLPVPVIVVGNVVAGGAGKTPVVLALVAHLQQLGIAVGVISRGYGRRSNDCLEVTPERSAQEVGDEPTLIQRRTGVPVFVATQRTEAAKALLARYPRTQLIVSDDGLQHLSLARDLEIGVFDDRGVGNGWLLPAGPLREPWPRAFDLVLHTGTQPAFAGFWGQRRLADYALRADGSSKLLADLANPQSVNAPSRATATASATRATSTPPTPPAAAFASESDSRPLLALAAIAQPEAFFAMLRAKGLVLAHTLALPDHYDFSSWQRNENIGYRLICTEKDAVKLWPLEPQALAVPLLFDLPPAFWQALDTRLGRLLKRPARPTR